MEVVKDVGIMTCERMVYIAREQYSSLGEGAASVSLGAVHMEEGVQVRAQVECGREEVNDGEKHG